MTASVDDPITVVEVEVTCPTAGCPNEGVPITAEVDEVAPYVVCGPCGAVLVGGGADGDDG